MDSISIQKSKSLIGCGGTLVILNGALLGFSLTFLALDGFYSLYAFVMASSAYHMMLGFIAVIGGHDLQRYRRCIVVSLVMSIIGCVIFILPSLLLAIISWVSIGGVCDWDCTYNNDTSQICNVCRNTSSRYLPILFVSICIGITDVVLSGLNCSNLCNCCNCGENGFETPGIVINPTVYACGGQILPTYAPQYPIPGQYPSNYAINPPVYAIDAHTMHQQNQSQLSDYQVQHEDRVPILSPNNKFY